jgi:hypothetical protein
VCFPQHGQQDDYLLKVDEIGHQTSFGREVLLGITTVFGIISVAKGFLSNY